MRSSIFVLSISTIVTMSLQLELFGQNTTPAPPSNIHPWRGGLTCYDDFGNEVSYGETCENYFDVGNQIVCVWETERRASCLGTQCSEPNNAGRPEPVVDYVDYTNVSTKYHVCEQYRYDSDGDGEDEFHYSFSSLCEIRDWATHSCEYETQRCTDCVDDQIVYYTVRIPEVSLEWHHSNTCDPDSGELNAPNLSPAIKKIGASLREGLMIRNEARGDLLRLGQIPSTDNFFSNFLNSGTGSGGGASANGNPASNAGNAIPTGRSCTQ